MKPRNKFEKAVLAESKNLRPITKTQSKWAFRECIDHFAYRLPKGRITCMDCGHSWTIEKTTEHCTCPHCRAKLQVRTTFERKIRQKQYFTMYVVKQKCTTANIVIYSEISLFYYQKFFC